MDRNILPIPISQTSSRVALRKESVDRNLADNAHFVTVCESLSARRAWIEITTEEVLTNEEQTVALRKESVDRNCTIVMVGLLMYRSLSARRAWIEIV